MFSKLSLVVSFAVLAVATAAPNSGSGGSSSCNNGPVQCCNSVQDASSPAVLKELGVLGIAIGSVDGLVGLTCSPVTVFGGSGESCSAQTVCCDNNSFNGLVALGCTPINIGL